MTDADAIKEAFSKAKNDIQSLKDQISILIDEMYEIKRTLEQIRSINQTHLIDNQSSQQVNPTDDPAYKSLKPHIYRISTGNGGVPTNRQTDKQTDTKSPSESKIDQIERVSEILESLDTIKKDLRSRFKHLTRQEMLVFSTLYQLHEESQNNDFLVDYSAIAHKLSLSESSIREYISKIIKKGIPIQKIKQNNKKILLKISDEFRKLASLQTILQLREL